MVFLMAINVALQPKQSELLRLIQETDYTMIGYGGSNGGGKSDGIRAANLILCATPKRQPIKTLIFRRKSNDLLENHIIPFFQRYPELDKLFNKTERIIYWTDGSTTKFGSSDIEGDITDFEGKEYDYIFVDEATHCTQYMIEYLKTRNRSGNVKAKMILTMIPGFTGHNYIKRLFITKKYLEYENPADYIYLPARVWDNVVWVENKLAEDGFTVKQYYENWDEEQRKSYTLQYSDYAINLSHLPENKKRARLFGDWFVFEGQFFEEFDYGVHVVKPDNYLTYSELKNFSCVVGMDYGNTTSLEFIARDHNDNFIIFDELHQEGLTRSVKIAQTNKFLKERGLEKITVVGDTNMWIKDAFDVDISSTPAYDYISSGIKLIKVSKISPTKNKGYREACNDFIKDLLHFENGTKPKIPKILIYERCKHLLETFPALVINEKNPDDIADGQNDHDYDAMKMGAMYLRKPREKPADDEPQWLRDMKKQQNNKVEKDFMAV